MEKTLKLPKNLEIALQGFVWATGDRVALETITLGGGSVLAARWDHRVSTDLDFFMSPESFHRQIGSRQEEMRDRLSSRGIKDVDVKRGYLTGTVEGIATSIHTSRPPALEQVTEIGEERTRSGAIATQSTETILIRKLHGRILQLGEFTERDMYDLAVCAELEPQTWRAVKETLTREEREDIAREIATLRRWHQPEQTLIAARRPLHGEKLRRAVARQLKASMCI